MDDKNKINVKLTKINEIFESLYKRGKGGIIFKNKFKKFSKLLQNKIINNKDKDIKMKINNHIEIGEKLNNALFQISIVLLKDFINNKKHKDIQEYLIILLFLMINDILKVEIFILILNVLLETILSILFNSDNNYKVFSLKKEPLLFINDIIESIIQYPINIFNDSKFIEELLNLFNNFFMKAKKQNIFIEKGEEWLKLLENKEINKEINKDYRLCNQKYGNYLENIIDFLIKIYKKHIPKHFYDEIYKKSAIDLPYYFIILTFLTLLYENEEQLKKNKEIKIKNALQFFGNSLSYDNVNYSSNELSLIISFKIKEIKNKEEDIVIFQLSQKKNIIKLIIDKENNLVIINNKDSKWNTNIIIEKNVFYFLCIIFYKKKKNIVLYINTDKISNNSSSKVFFSKNCYKYSSKKNEYPDFVDKMTIKLGDTNFYGIIGEVFLIKEELDKNSIKYLFASIEYYPDLLNRNKVNYSIIENKFLYSKKIIDAKNYFNNLKYECILRIMPNTFFQSNIQNKEINIYEYKIINSYITFLNEKGIEFLIFMLHDINSQINNNQLFNIYIYKTIDFLYYIINKYIEIENNILEDEKGIYDSYLEINKNDIINQIYFFFLTLLTILKNRKKNNKDKKFLSDDVGKLLINFLSLKFNKFDNKNIYINIIVYILFEFDLIILDLTQFIKEKTDILIINEEMIINTFLLDYIFLKKEQHKKLSNLIETFLFIKRSNKIFCKELVKYISRMKNEIKIYHYLKIIYYNFKEFDSALEEEEKNIFLSFIELKLKKSEQHCKYCSYNFILCYLLKEEFFNKSEVKKGESFNYKSFKYMLSPPFLFIRCIFIQKFKLENKEKFNFIKSKDEPYNFDFFEYSIQLNPIDFCDNEILSKRFIYIVKYINTLMNSGKAEQMKNLFENYFLFIKEFLDIIINMKTLKTKKELFNIINSLFSSRENNFFILYLNYDEKKGIELIKYYLKLSFIIFLNPILKLILPQIKIGNNKKSDRIKNEIIKYIINQIVANKKKIGDNFIILFLTFVYKNIFEENIEISKDFPEIFLNLVSIISEKKFFLDRHPINLTDIGKESKNYIEDIKEINKVKFISELIIDIIIKFYIDGYYNDDDIKNIIINKKNLFSIFYNNDVENLKNNNKKNSPNEQNQFQYFLKEINNFLFSLYYLIVFFNKLSLCKNKIKEKSLISCILELLFNDITIICYNNKKIFSNLKKITNYGGNFELYNQILSTCNKYYKEGKLNLNFLLDKYNEIKIPEKNINFNDAINNQYIIIEGRESFNKIKNKINVNNEKKIIRSKSFNKLISTSFKEKLFENIFYQTKFISNSKIEDNIINQTMIFNENKKNKNYLKEDNTNSNIYEINAEDEKYLKNELSRLNNLNIFNEKIINDSGLYKDMKMLFNPKEYFLWHKYTIIFKDLIYNNKKFKKLSKVFDIYSRNIKVIYSSKRDKELFLNYPTKIKNYIIDDYYRPFLKPCLNFFTQKYIESSHSYMKKNILINPQFKEDNFYLIKFERIFPNLINKDKEKIIKCERIQNKGNIFGYIIFKKYFMIFVNSPDDKELNSNDLNMALKYVFSSIEDSTIDKNKYNIIFYNDIKEVIKRRYMLTYIGCEIFTKDNHSYLFNFFDKKYVNSFFEEIKKCIQEEDKKKDKNKISLNIINSNNIINNNKYDCRLIENPIQYFKKMEYKYKYKRGEISNFIYLLLLNKFSSRTYNENNQYLIFPLLFMDISQTKKRDLSKALCLNKIDNKESFEKCKSNKKYMGYYFTQHYSTSGFIIYYLIRQIPFTYCNIELQSGRFDLPGRIFNSLKNHLGFINFIQENRELCPEFYCNYEFLLNLNHNGLGESEDQNSKYIINNFDNNNNETCIQFIINLKKLLEERDITPWIDNIFGSKQFSNDDEYPNSFPLYSYESNVDYEKIKQEGKPLNKRIEEIKQKIALLKFGIVPARIFIKNHPKVIKNINNNNELEEEVNIFAKKQKTIIKIINDFIKEKTKDNKDYYLINRKHDNDIELIFKFYSEISILIIKLVENKYFEFSLLAKEQLEIEPYNNLFCEINPGIYCIVRNRDKTIRFVSFKKIIEVYQWTCIVTAIQPFISRKKSEDKNIKNVLIGDEKGYLYLLEIEYILNYPDKSEIKSIQIINSVKAQNSLIKGIVYNEKLNIIITWNDEGVISIINDYSFNFLNIIDLGINYDIREILISKYDLLYVNCYDIENKEYKINCYTLNGIQATYYYSREKIINFYIDETINIIIENRNIVNYNCCDLYRPQFSLYCEYIDNSISNKITIKFCCYYPRIKKYLIIYSDNNVNFQNIEEESISNI